MTLSDTGKIISVLLINYPNHYRNTDDNQKKALISLWHTMLGQYDYKLINGAVMAILTSNKFPPTIADVIEKINFITKPKEMTELEAWGLVLKAIRNSGYSAKEEFEKLPEIIRGIVGTPGQLSAWGMMDSGDVQTVISSNFQRSYRARVKNEREYAALPSSVKELSKKLSESFGNMELIGDASYEK